MNKMDGGTGTGVKRISKVECIGVEKRTTPNKHFVYVLHVSWSNGMKHPIYRTHSTFFDLKACLVEEFRGRQDISSRLPELPGLNQFEKKGIFAFRENAAEKRKRDVQAFCSKILALPESVITSNTVASFFEAWYSDFAQLPPTSTMSLSRSPKPQRKHTPHLSSIIENLKNKRFISHDSPAEIHSQKEKDTLQRRGSLNAEDGHQPLPSSIPLNQDTSKTRSLPRGMQLQEPAEEIAIHPQLHRATCNYKRRKPGELDLKVGTIVDVLECNQSGWWFVDVEGTHEQGWAPGAFLEPIQQTPEHSTTSGTSDQDTKEGVYFMLCDYIARNPDEISCRRSEELTVLEKHLDGWWKVRCGHQEGYVPAIHLEKVAGHICETKKAEASTLFHRKSMHRRGPPPRKSQRNRCDHLAWDSSMKRPVYCEIPINDSDMERTLESQVPLSSSTPELNKPPVYAQVNKVWKTPSSEELGKRGGAEFVVTEDGLKYSMLTFDESAAKVAPKECEKVEYMEIGPHNPSKPANTTPANTTPANTTPANTTPDDGSHLYDNSPFTNPEPPVPHKSDLISSSKPATSESPPPIQARNHTSPHTYENVVKTTQLSKGHHGYENVPKEELQEMKFTPPMYSPRNCGQIFAFDKSPNHDTRVAPHPAPRMRQALSRPEEVSPLSSPPGTPPMESGSPHHPKHYSAPLPLPLEEQPPEIPKKQFVLSDSALHEAGKSESGAHPSAEPAEHPVRHEWLVGKMSRAQCDQLLLTHGQQRDFLIRESTNRVGDFTLSVRYETRVRHFPIKITPSNRYYIGKYHFKDLSKVVQYYRTHPLFYDDNEQAVQLGEPVKR